MYLCRCRLSGSVSAPGKVLLCGGYLIIDRLNKGTRLDSAGGVALLRYYANYYDLVDDPLQDWCLRQPLASFRL